MAKVAFLGLGVMGYPMAGHLKAKGGHEVTVYNRTIAKAERWVAQHQGRLAPTPRQAAHGQDFVMACVGNDDDLRQVTLGPDGAFAGIEKGAVFVDHTTASADIARELHAQASRRGFDFIDAPVSGGQAGAENGAFTVMCGGDAAPYGRAESVIMAYARMCKLLGPAGAGQLTKMVNQICIGGLVQALSEGLHFARQGRPRRRSRGRNDLQGRGPVLADGEPLQDHARRQVRFRLRGRLDAQGSLHLPRRGAPQRRPAAGHRAGRSVLLGGAEDGRPALGYLEPVGAARTVKASASEGRSIPGPGLENRARPEPCDQARRAEILS